MKSLNDLERLEKFDGDPRIQKLDSYVPPFSILRILRYHRNEWVHSELIAALLRPSENRGALDSLRVLLTSITCALEAIDRKNEASRLQSLCENLSPRPQRGSPEVLVHRERAFVDIVIELGDYRGAAIGIENKVDASEREKQLSDYQSELQKLYPQRTAVMVFLTPDGRPAKTSSETHRVPSVSLGYEAVLGAVEAAATNHPEASAGLEEFARHVREDIMKDVTIRRKSREIWMDHWRALQLLLKHQPTLEDIYDSYIQKVENTFEDVTGVQSYPTKGNIREIKWELSRWNAQGIQLVFMLHTSTHADTDGRPRFRLLLRDSWYEDHMEELGRLAKTVNAKEDEIQLDENFAVLRGWPTWRRVLEEDHYPDSARLDDVIIPDETEERAITKAREWVRALDPYVRDIAP